jgi:hypothetical protein
MQEKESRDPARAQTLGDSPPQTPSQGTPSMLTTRQYGVYSVLKNPETQEFFKEMSTEDRNDFCDSMNAAGRQKFNEMEPAHQIEFMKMRQGTRSDPMYVPLGPVRQDMGSRSRGSSSSNNLRPKDSFGRLRERARRSRPSSPARNPSDLGEITYTKNVKVSYGPADDGKKSRHKKPGRGGSSSGGDDAAAAAKTATTKSKKAPTKKPPPAENSSARSGIPGHRDDEGWLGAGVPTRAAARMDMPAPPPRQGKKPAASGAGGSRRTTS